MLSWLEQNFVFPKQKQSVQPSGLNTLRSKVPAWQVSQPAPSTLGLHRHSEVS